jgi:hypothetical protein
MRKHGVWAVPTLTVDNAFGHLDDARFCKDERLTYFHGEFRSWLEAKDDFRLKGYTDRDYEVERELVTEKKKLVAAMYRAGVPILAGTDVGNPFCFPAFSLHDELALLVESGLTPLAALQASTRNAAIFMNAADRYGSVSKGKIADLVLLDANPLQDIHNTTKISEVLFGWQRIRSGGARSYPGLSRKECECSADAHDARPRCAKSDARYMGDQCGVCARFRQSRRYRQGHRNLRPGPGGRSVIEEYREKNAHGEVEV